MKTKKKVAIVTGGASGIGFYAAQKLVASGYHVVLGVRNIKKGAEAALQLKSASADADVDVLPLDLSDARSIREFAEDVAGRFEKVEILLHNAGVMAAAESRTSDGWDFELATNFIGPFLLTNLLLPYMDNESGRIITVTSDEYEKVKAQDINIQNPLERKEKTDPMRWYGITKLYVLMFAIELQKKLERSGSNIKSLTAHPGLAGTDLAANIPSPTTRFFMKFGMKLMGQSPKSGARSFVHAALSADVKGGQLWAPGGFGGLRGAPVIKTIFPLALDRDVTAKVWSAAEKVTNMPFSIN
ncbi:SDR family NAD(P)-dependent oxidoreductase [Mucilaginibacter sp. 22184]|uniref:SDR family NAD(P)-dependent oxidoreductase n=1 Tax=Mucilaginibacter sp. 22184 TaxID=3453887 RepID=UPI003F86C37B